MNQRRQGLNIFGYWFPVTTVWVIVILLITLVGGIASILTANNVLLPVILGLLLATAVRLLCKLVAQESRRS